MFFIVIFTVLVHNCFAQKLELSFNCRDVKIISEYTGDTIDRCELFLNKAEALKNLGSNLEYIIRKDMLGFAEFYFFDKSIDETDRDVFEFYQDSDLNQGGFVIFSKKFTILLDNKYLIRVGDHIENCFEEFKPIPIRGDYGRMTSIVLIHYSYNTLLDKPIAASVLAIVFDNKSKKIIRISDHTDPDY